MKCVLVQEKWVDWPDAVNDRVGNILMSGRGYAVRHPGRLEGMIIDPVYEGHLGGQPALNAYSGLFTRTERIEA